MRVHLIDGTYELFRQHFGQVGAPLGGRSRTPRPSAWSHRRCSSSPRARRTSASPATTSSRAFATTCGRATRPAPAWIPELLVQIPLMEEALGQRRVHDVGDGRVRGRRRAWAPPRRSPTPTRGSTQVLIVTPDKDLGQCVRGTRVVQYDRRKGEIVDEAAVTAKFGVGPASIADYLALVGDSADGFPGLAGWGAKSAADRARQVRLDRRRSRPSSGDWGLAGAARRREAGRHAPRPTSSSLCCSGASPRSRSTSTSARSTTGAGQGPTTSFAAMCRPTSARRTWWSGPQRLAREPANARHPPSEVTARLPAAHERLPLKAATSRS